METVLGIEKTQCEAAIDAVRKIGLRQLCEVDQGLFDKIPEYVGMFEQRLSALRKYSKGEG